MEYIFYLNQNKEKVGPIKLTELAKNPLSADTLVWTVGMKEWKKASEVKELEGYFIPDFDGKEVKDAPLPPKKEKETHLPPKEPSRAAATNLHAQSNRSATVVPPIPASSTATVTPGNTVKPTVSASNQKVSLPVVLAFFISLVAGGLYFLFIMPITCLVANILDWSPTGIAIILGIIVLFSWAFIANNFVRETKVRVIVLLFIFATFGGGATFVYDKVRSHKFYNGECQILKSTTFEYYDSNFEEIKNRSKDGVEIRRERIVYYDKWGTKKYKTVKSLYSSKHPYGEPLDVDISYER